MNIERWALHRPPPPRLPGDVQTVTFAERVEQGWCWLDGCHQREASPVGLCQGHLDEMKGESR